ncbi:MAG: carboxypeptidase-like regulatory domain-containing protein [Bryobacteraceae bacterium]|nr:carboxypeptidase-like regulatory domain-containing protein [Bryobacteraceae bacterium]
MRGFRIVFLSACVAVGLSFAQDVRARLQGLVTDASQAVVAGAEVTLKNEGTSITATTRTNENGQYLFDFVVAGDYTVTVERPGFRKYVQRKILVQSRADITVDARLDLGSTTEAVTVQASPVSVQFNTSSMGLTLDKKMTNELPVINRNPFLLAQLNPAAVIRSTTEQSPYHHWASTQIDVGGNTSTKNDVVVDGSPNMASEKSAYTPAMDAVQEVTVQQNAVDAEFGHSAGGVITVQMKSGTNDFHGTGYYLGRNPAINAVADHITRRANLTRNHILGGTLGSPVIRNKLFNFVSYEMWRSQDPRSVAFTLPTEAERTGDFSRSVNARGGLRAIYNPFTTVLNENGTATRQPFPGNAIPASQQDPVGRRVMNDIWKPNLPGDGSDAVNNYRTGFAERVKYWNFSDRADWSASDKLKIFGRFSMFKTFVTQDNYANSRAVQPNGSERHAWTSVMDAVYTINASTVFNVRGGFNRIFDSFAVAESQITPAELTTILGSEWHTPYSKDAPALYYPGFTIRRGPSATNLGRTGFWYQDPETYNLQSKVSRSQGRHYFKVGGEWRSQRVVAVRPRPVSFDVRPEHTASTFLNPDLNLSGDAWATLLVGALDNNTLIQSLPTQLHRNEFYGLYFHDDIKVTQRLTINVGLRYEYESPMVDPRDRLSRYLDLSSPIPEFQGANAPVLPAAAAALRTGGPIYNGAWVFTDSENRGSWNAQKLLLMPRAGLAYRLNNLTALRFGYARYLVPSTLTDGLDILGSVFYPGFEATSRGLPLLTGVPQSTLSNPFPGGLVPVSGKTFGRYTDLGGAPIFYNQDFRVGVNDRFNFSVQRALPGQLVLDATYFRNFGRNAPVTRNLNQVDPRIGYTRGAATAANVPNPFFNRLSADKMPGQLRTQANVPVTQLLRQYPQYGDIQQRLTGQARNRYEALQMSLQRPFVNGFNLVLGYNYNRERNQEYYDEQDNFLDNLTSFRAVNPRHRLTGAAIYQLPFGKGRTYMSGANRVVDGLFGGWSLSGLFSFNTGQYLRFGGLLVDGDPALDSPTKGRMFDTSKFQRLPAFTRRTNPLQYDGVKGMRFKNVDLTLAKSFALTEHIRFELRMESYNAFNNFNGDLPSTNFGTSAFGTVNAQMPGYLGRQFQYSGRFTW